MRHRPAGVPACRSSHSEHLPPCAGASPNSTPGAGRRGGCDRRPSRPARPHDPAASRRRPQGALELEGQAERPISAQTSRLPPPPGELGHVPGRRCDDGGSARQADDALPCQPAERRHQILNRQRLYLASLSISSARPEVLGSRPTRGDSMKRAALRVGRAVYGRGDLSSLISRPPPPCQLAAPPDCRGQAGVLMRFLRRLKRRLGMVRLRVEAHRRHHPVFSLVLPRIRAARCKDLAAPSSGDVVGGRDRGRARSRPFSPDAAAVGLWRPLERPNARAAVLLGGPLRVTPAKG